MSGSAESRARGPQRSRRGGPRRRHRIPARGGRSKLRPAGSPLASLFSTLRSPPPAKIEARSWPSGEVGFDRCPAAGGVPRPSAESGPVRGGVTAAATRGGEEVLLPPLGFGWLGPLGRSGLSLMSSKVSAAARGDPSSERPPREPGDAGGGPSPCGGGGGAVAVCAMGSTLRARRS